MSTSPTAPGETFDVSFHVSRRIYERIGRVSNAWSQLERFIDIEIWYFSEIRDEVGACITAHLQSAERRLQCLVAIFRLRKVDDKLIKEFHKLVESISDMARQRNRIIHDPWINTQGKDHRWEITANRTLVMDIKDQTMSDLDTLIRKIAKITEDYHNIIQRIRATAPRLPGTSPPSWPVQSQ